MCLSNKPTWSTRNEASKTLKQQIPFPLHEDCKTGSWEELQPSADARWYPPVNYWFAIYHWYVPHNVVWSDWTSFYDDEPYYDVWG